MRFAASSAWLGRASAVTPGGAQTGSKAPGKVGPLGAFPLYAAHASGALLTDVDGHDYIDFYNGNCAVVLGHGDQRVTSGVTEALSRYGALASLPTRLEVVTAEAIQRAVPCAQRVRFVKTGSEACAAAVRIARMATGRDVIVCAEGQYHGWHDWHCVTKPFRPGVPAALDPLVRTFRWRDTKSLDGVLGDDVAAIIVEPALPDHAYPTWLRALRLAADRHGAILIFDEMITGGRLHVGGAQAVAGVPPDLATCGKAYANGFPLAFVAGRADLMVHAWPVSGTFGGEVTGLAAAKAVLEIHETEDVTGQLARVGCDLMAGFNQASRDVGLVARMVGEPCRPWVEWMETDSDRLLLIRSLFQQELSARGVLTHWSAWNPSVAHTSELVRQTIDAIHGALRVVQQAMDGDRPASWLRGDLIQPAFTRPV